MFLVSGFFRIVLLAAFLLQAFALIDSIIRPAAAYLAAGKLTKAAWVSILAVALVAVQLSGWFGTLGLAAIVATIVYFVDVRPALRRVTGR